MFTEIFCCFVIIKSMFGIDIFDVDKCIFKKMKRIINLMYCICSILGD